MGFSFGPGSCSTVIGHLRSFITTLPGTGILKPRKVTWSWKGYLTFPSPPVLRSATSQAPWVMVSEAPGSVPMSQFTPWSPTCSASGAGPQVFPPYCLASLHPKWQPPTPRPWGSCFLCYCVHGCVPSHE